VSNPGWLTPPVGRFRGNVRRLTLIPERVQPLAGQTRPGGLAARVFGSVLAAIGKRTFEFDSTGR
jgi:hypothetical protein